MMREELSSGVFQSPLGKRFVPALRSEGNESDARDVGRIGEGG